MTYKSNDSNVLKKEAVEQLPSSYESIGHDVTLAKDEKESDVYNLFLPQDEYLESVNNPTGRTKKVRRSIDSILPSEAVSKVREEMALKHGNELGRAFFNEESRNFLETEIRKYILEEKINVEGMAYKELAKAMLDEIAGLGPIEPLMKDETITDIMINGPYEVRIERNGIEEPTDIRFEDNEHVLMIARKMLNLAGESVNTANPDVDARLPDSRINVSIPPIARNGVTITIRKYPPINMSEENMIENQLLTQEMIDFLKLVVRGAANMLIVGATGSGKTTLIKRLADYIPNNQRVLTIEDTEELRLKDLYPEKHIISLECRLTDKDETNIDMSRLLKSGLRKNIKRILTGEVRGPEAAVMIEAMNTGHDGGMTTLHANNAADSVDRLIQMILRGGMRLSDTMIGKMVAKTIDIIVFQEKMRDGVRRITEIVEVIGYKNDEPIITPIYRFAVNDSENEKVIGTHIRHQNGYLSKKLAEKLISKGVSRSELREWIREEDVNQL